jgi:ATP-dependent phosphofructokinase / diphosphate-dependent phosphofructokinase
MSNALKGGKLGILVGGGPAPGINGVISSVTIEAINQGMEVLGFKNGFRHLVEGSLTENIRLTKEFVEPHYLAGGSILGTARTNPAKKEEDMAKVLEVLHKLGISCLVTIGGDDTAFSGSQVAKRVGPAAPRDKHQSFLRVCHVPKTIDNDLPLPEGTPTFGFETARHLGTLTTRALYADAKTTGRWYIIISMGRAAGHLALGIGKSSASTITLIPEEFRDNPVTLEAVADLIIGSILKNRLQGRNYGVAVLAEGLIESIGEKGLLSSVGEAELKHYGRLERDDHGHMRLGEIEFGRLVKDYLKSRLKELGLKVDFIAKDLGYELRSADPIPFDAEYTRDLGYGAVQFLGSDAATQYGAIISFIDGRMVPLPFEQMIDPKTSRMRPRKVNIDSEAFHCAQRYMIRLEKADFEDPAKLKEISGLTNLSPDQFRSRFEPISNL